MTAPFEIVPGEGCITLRTDDGTEKVLSIGEAVALRSGLVRAVSEAHRPDGPLDRVYPDRMDDVWAYIPLASLQTHLGVYVVGRRGGTYAMTVFDCFGQSPVSFSSTRPRMGGLKPYVMVRDFSSLFPYLAIYRQAYRDNFLLGCGLRDFDIGETFEDAVEHPEGAVVFVSRRAMRDGCTRQRVSVIDLFHGRCFSRDFFSDGPDYPYRLRDDMRHLTREEAISAASDAATSWYDLLVETVRPWFPDGEGVIG